MNFQDKTILLQSENISHSFDNKNILFKEISISVKETETVSIIGVSGSGKSTLLHILSGTIKPQKGSISHFGKDFWKQKQKEREMIRRNEIGLIFQFHYLFKGFSVRENLEVASLLSGEKLDKSILDKFGISHLLEKKVTQLSGGEQQRVSIARVLTKKPRIIFADELTGNLDKQTANIVMRTLFDYIKTNKASLVLVTHDEDLASKTDQIFQLKDGDFCEK